MVRVLRNVLIIGAVGVFTLISCSSSKNAATASAVEANSGKVWYNWDDGLAYAKKHKKIVLVDVYTDWCGWCKRMDKTTYENTDVQAALVKDFVSIKINPEKTNTYKIGDKSYTGYELMKFLANGQLYKSYPTTYFWVDPSNGQKAKKKYMQMGYLTASQMQDVLKKMVKVRDEGTKS